MAVAVSCLHPTALIRTPYQLPRWCLGALDSSRESHQLLAASQSGRPSPRLGRGTLGGGSPGRDIAVGAGEWHGCGHCWVSHVPGISQASGADRLQPYSQGESRAVLSGVAPRGWRASTMAQRQTSPNPPGSGSLWGLSSPPAPWCLGVVKALRASNPCVLCVQESRDHFAA